MIPNIPTSEIIPTRSIEGDPNYKGLKIIRCQTDKTAESNYLNNRYQFQSEKTGAYNVLRATLCRKGYIDFGQEDGDERRFRLTLMLHPKLREFTQIVMYDPSDPDPDSYEALGMSEAHKQTQSDFKGAKKRNRDYFRDYLLESINGPRIPYLPVISGWQSPAAFRETVFVAFDEVDENALYGIVYLPQKPIMQADGQTQTAALFAVKKTKEAVTSGALDKLTVTLEVELDVDEEKAGQSFADRNGRGTKKNKNLVIGLDTSSALSQLRIRAIKGTVFDGRVAIGREGGTSESATTNIVDLSTMEQLSLRVVSPDGNLKPEQFRHEHVEHYVEVFHDFLMMLTDVFGPAWDKSPGSQKDTFRTLYIHGWPFALKGIASAYHLVRVNELGPMLRAFGVKNVGLTGEKRFSEAVQTEKKKWKELPTMGLDEFRSRLEKINWLRYKAHWIKLTGHKIQAGAKKTFKLKSNGEKKVAGRVPGTFASIKSVTDLLLSDSWKCLCATADESLD